ncbi:prodigiosin synthesizing transferase PigC [Caerostris extrusa]|uniref:Prodigiosin synthesizing transferase PigC n=1 Tax=Caerostris extrusa TaxID=172846 RepID=A0AAV4QBY8_CAEEX|nr:prodigiosin synthesizing transferase PigC [Caerostris extrusa]
MSAAGQMDTFLGVQGLKKKRNGQSLNSPNGSCDSRNGGLRGFWCSVHMRPTVVSGTVEARHFFLCFVKERTKDQSFRFSVGSKHQKNLMMQDSGGTATEDIEEDSRNESCLSKETAERLGEIAIKIEDYYRSSRDIEWGILNDKSRPVTNAAAETDNEIKHEFDPPLRCENEYFTVANVGEVLPGAVSTLGLEILPKYWCIIIRRDAMLKGLGDHLCKSTYFLTGMFAFCNRLMITVVEMLNRYGFGTTRSKAFMISLFGRILDDPDLLSYAESRSTTTSVNLPIKTRIRNCWDKYFFDLGLEKLKAKVDNYQLKFLEYKTAKETYLALINSCSEFDEVADKI